MDPTASIIAGSTIATVLGVEYGGVFMLSILKRRRQVTDVQHVLFRAGHAYAGVLIILGLVVLLLLDTSGVLILAGIDHY